MDTATFLQLAISAGSIIGALAVARWRVNQSEMRLGKLEDEFHRHQLDIAEKYVSAANFTKFETEIKGAIDRLSSRIDLALASKSRTRG